MARLLRIAGLVAALWASGCTSPTLPLPPPNLSELRLDNDRVTVEGTAIAGAMVFVWNRDLGEGAITEAQEGDGYFMAVVPGDEGHVIVVWSQLDGEQSPTIERVVRAPR